MKLSPSCSFTFNGKNVVTLEENFLDDLPRTEEKIRRETAKLQIPQYTREFIDSFIEFMRGIVKK
ncbi:MAG: hypothetical protein IJ523_04885 [Succinivibrionaceae bacterium]|nr:hypothetical protein [Succinivibrionaceae bacterium]